MNPSMDERAWEAAARRLDEAVAAAAACRFDEAEGLAEEASAALRATVGEQHPDHANALDLLGSIAAATGRPRLAVERFTAALAIHDRYQSSEEDASVIRPMRAETLANLGDQLARQGQFAAAEPRLREALDEAERAFGAGALAVAVYHNRLAVFLRFAGAYREAAASYERAEAIRRTHGEPTPAVHFHNLAGLACAEGDFQAAERYAREAIALSSRDLRAGVRGDGFCLGGDLCGLGDALAGQGRHAEAEACYREALDLFARSARPDHPEVAYALHNLGDALCAVGRTADAESCYRESIARKTAAFGEHHHEIAGTLANLAAMLFETGRRAEARAAMQRALSIARGVLPESHPIRAGCESLARAIAP